MTEPTPQPTTEEMEQAARDLDAAIAEVRELGEMEARVLGEMS